MDFGLRLKNEWFTLKKESGKVVETSEEKDEFPREKDEEFPREYCFSTTWTLDPAVKPFGSTVKKEAWKFV